MAERRARSAHVCDTPDDGSLCLAHAARRVGSTWICPDCGNRWKLSQREGWVLEKVGRR